MNSDFVVNLITVESNWNPNAVSEDKAAGLAQMIPDTAKQYGIPYADLFQPLKSIDAAIKYLADHAKTLGNDQLRLAVAYNAGLPALQRNEKANGGLDVSKLNAETKFYIAKLRAAGSDLSGGISKKGEEFAGSMKELVAKARQLPEGAIAALAPIEASVS